MVHGSSRGKYSFPVLSLVFLLVAVLLVALAAYAVKMGKNFSAEVKDGKGMQMNFSIREPDKNPTEKDGGAKKK